MHHCYRKLKQLQCKRSVHQLNIHQAMKHANVQNSTAITLITNSTSNKHNITVSAAFYASQYVTSDASVCTGGSIGCSRLICDAAVSSWNSHRLRSDCTAWFLRPYANFSLQRFHLFLHLQIRTLQVGGLHFSCK